MFASVVSTTVEKNVDSVASTEVVIVLVLVISNVALVTKGFVLVASRVVVSVGATEAVVMSRICAVLVSIVLGEVAILSGDNVVFVTAGGIVVVETVDVVIIAGVVVVVSKDVVITDDEVVVSIVVVIVKFCSGKFGVPIVGVGKVALSGIELIIEVTSSPRVAAVVDCNSSVV